MKMLINFLLFLLLLAILFLVITFFIPGAYSVNRSVEIAAPRAEIYEQIASLQKWDNWSAWNKAKDTSLTYTYEGPDSGVGALSKWTSSNGNGTLEITEADPKTGITYIMQMDNWNPNQAGFDLEAGETNGNTKVTWNFSGDMGKNPMKKIMKFFFVPMLKADFDTGLEQLKAKLEGTEKEEMDEEEKPEPSAPTGNEPATKN